MIRILSHGGIWSFQSKAAGTILIEAVVHPIIRCQAAVVQHRDYAVCKALPVATNEILCHDVDHEDARCNEASEYGPLATSSYQYLHFLGPEEVT